MNAVLEMNTYVQENSLRDKVIKKMKELNLNVTRLGERIGVHRSTVSSYLNNNYHSNPEEIEKKLEQFLSECGKEEIVAEKNVTTKENVVTYIKKKRAYFESVDFIQTIGICQVCQEHRDLGLIVGKSGYGKTHTLKKYAELQRTIYIECNEVMNQKDLIRKIERAIGFPKTYGSIDERLEGLADFFNVNEGYLLIIDEADKLITKYTQKKIELIRNIADLAQNRVGIVLAGEPALESMIKMYDDRFANRMTYYYKLKGLKREEIRSYFDGYDMDDMALEEFICRATNKQNGCFRLLDRTLNNVIRILKDSGQTKVTMKVLSAASNMMLL